MFRSINDEGRGRGMNTGRCIRGPHNSDIGILRPSLHMLTRLAVGQCAAR